jgi:hypothetical protein
MSKILTDELVEKARNKYDAAYEAEYMAHGTQGNDLVAMRAALLAILPDMGEAFATIAEEAHSKGWVQSADARKWGLKIAAAIRAAAKGE